MRNKFVQLLINNCGAILFSGRPSESVKATLSKQKTLKIDKNRNQISF